MEGKIYEEYIEVVTDILAHLYGRRHAFCDGATNIRGASGRKPHQLAVCDIQSASANDRLRGRQGNYAASRSRSEVADYDNRQGCCPQ